MRKIIDLTGQRFGRLTVIKFAETKNHTLYWKCKCDCGNIKIIAGNDLKSKKIKSCGCLRKEKASNLNKKHNLCNTRIYNIFLGAKSRCYNIKDKAYKNYGGRGIKICNEWLNDFMNFYNWAINSGYQDNLTLDRIDVNKNYEPNNCRWTTMKEQENNRTNNRRIKYKEKIYTLSQLSNILGLSSVTLKWRLDHNWNENELSLKTNFGNNKIRKEYNKNE